MRVYALVPARSGSKGLPDKNIQDIGGHPLMAYAIAFGRELGIDRVIVSTDSERYAEIARIYGADCPVVVAFRVGWPDQSFLFGTLSDIRGKVRDAKLTRTALIFVGRVFEETHSFPDSALYDATQAHVLRPNKAR